MPKYKVVLAWTVTGEIELSANDREQAAKIARENTYLITKPPMPVIDSLYVAEITEIQ